ncbi:MAG: nitroreductase family protein [Magnetococcales bacterium]|nr:nitroreductase family protein [Magnetococcales bacterium]
MNDPSTPAGHDGHTVLDYHEQSKHAPHRMAPGPDHLDWAQQPDPFRTYEGAPVLQLPLVADALQTRYADLYRPTAVVPAVVMDCRGIAALLELALGLSAWKVSGSTRWALRCNPSSGNLHPTEGYVIVPSMDTEEHPLAAGVYHYVSRNHILEQRVAIPAPDRDAWTSLLPPHTFLLGLTAIHWREAWKYGERAFRYCQLDAGHAMAAVRYAAAALGWQAHLLATPATQDVVRLLGLAGSPRPDAPFGHDHEPEHPDCLIQVTLPGETQADMSVQVGQLADIAVRGHWLGEANRLSRHARQWPKMDTVARAVWQPLLSEVPGHTRAHLPALTAVAPGIKAADLIRQRRSAQAFDNRAWLDQEALWHILDATLPRSGCAPWDLLPWEPRIHPVLMVHRVRGLPAGLYILVRSPAAQPLLQAALHAAFVWSPVPGMPAHLPLFLLQEGDMRALAQTLSCQQEIAGDSALSLGMLGEYHTSMTSGPWGYCRLFWEAGMIGQTLYLEAEAAGVRGTGIGCFFDDLFHQLLGLKEAHLQSFYHFTIGLPILDHRLQTETPYVLS